jgi:hypothetical protein
MQIVIKQQKMENTHTRVSFEVNNQRQFNLDIEEKEIRRHPKIKVIDLHNAKRTETMSSQ